MADKKRLIDANELLEPYDIGEELEQQAGKLSVPIAVVRQNIKDMPTVDAVEVVHGRWVDREDYYTETGMTCSVCGERYWLDTCRIDFKQYCYCPNCGAKMDGADTERRDDDGR